MSEIPLGLIKCLLQASSETAYVTAFAFSSLDALLSSITQSDQKPRSSLSPVFMALRGNGFLGIQTPKSDCSPSPPCKVLAIKATFFHSDESLVVTGFFGFFFFLNYSEM